MHVLIVNGKSLGL